MPRVWIGCLALLTFGGWLLWRGLEHPRVHDQAPPLVAADPSPYKIKAAEAVHPYAGYGVFGMLRPNSATEEVVQLRPEPETPRRPPVPAP